MVTSTITLISACLGGMLAPTVARGDTASRRTIANGNLLIPKSTGIIPITLPRQKDTLEVLLAEIFRLAQVPFKIDRSAAAYVCEVSCNLSPFYLELPTMMFDKWDCAIVDGVYSVFKLQTTGIFPGRPDLDTAWFTREVHTYMKVRPFFAELFREANLQYVLSPDCPDFMPGMKVKAHFRELLKCALWDKLTFEVRDGVYYISPKPEGYV